MELIDEVADELNELLDAKRLDKKKLKKLIGELMKLSRVEFRFLNFEFFNADLKELAVERKIKHVSESNFEAASRYRELEVECLSYLRFKKYFSWKDSLFYPERNMLLYFYTGKSKNDLELKEYFVGAEEGFLPDPTLAFINIMNKYQ